MSSLGPLVFGATGTAGCGSDEPGATTAVTTVTSAGGGEGGNEDGGGGGTGGNEDGGAGGGTGGEGGEPPLDMCDQDERTPEEFFNDVLAPQLLDECGVCHVSGGIGDFLAGPDEYRSISTYQSGITGAPLINDIPEQSFFYTYPDSSDHNGKPFADAQMKLDALCYLKKESASIPVLDPEEDKAILPIKPLMGVPNTIVLTPLGSGFENTAIYFTPTEIGANGQSLVLSNMEVYPAVDRGVHLVHPTFYICPEGTDQCFDDPSEALSTVDQTFLFGGERRISTGEVVLTNWSPNARLGIRFELAEALFLTEGGGALIGCEDVDGFEDAVTALGNNGPMYCAQNCHGGAKQEAQEAMDLAGLIANPPQWDAACSSMRIRINIQDPPNSQIIQVTKPGLPIIHLFKFNGNIATHSTFADGMTPWIQAEAGQ